MDAKHEAVNTLIRAKLRRGYKPVDREVMSPEEREEYRERTTKRDRLNDFLHRAARNGHGEINSQDV